ncbi:MAG: hypothetical protein N2039_09420 [Gemmataceae bacterium]|nr:hypothetical protein [Gemmataceae bacterium]
MIGALVITTVLGMTPTQTGGLQLTNERITFGGEFGPVRPDHRFLPGDLFFLAFDIEGLKQDSQGRVEYLMGMVVTHDASNKVIFESKPSPQSMILPLGATRLPARAFILLGLDLRGPCTCRVTVTDKATGVTRHVEKKFLVMEPTFGMVAFRATYDREGQYPAPLQGVAGQSLWLQFGTVGFSRNPQTRQPHNQVELRVFDAKGQPTTEEPLVYEIKSGVDEEANALDWRIPLPLNRPGNYRVELKAMDKVTNSAPYKISFSVQVFESVK